MIIILNEVHKFYLIVQALCSWCENSLHCVPSDPDTKTMISILIVRCKSYLVFALCLSLLLL